MVIDSSEQNGRSGEGFNVIEVCKDIGDLQEQLRTVAAANSFQSLMEHTVDQLAAIAAPLSSIGLRPEGLDAHSRTLEEISDQLGLLRSHRDNVARDLEGRLERLRDRLSTMST